ncbi:MAG: hypothetical protein KAH93_05935, partial [Candidatus Aenigmarchaeota archaeon]|nr:hypothetical protein [Candidatus Aenigmarchaeota archaeon]
MPYTIKPYISPIITFSIIAILLISGPVQAMTVKIMSLPGQATLGDEINFTLKIDIETGERIPIKEIMLNIDSTECRYHLNGTLNSSSPANCSAFTLTQTQDAPYTYGQRYGYGSNNQQNYGYGYGYGYG